MKNSTVYHDSLNDYNERLQRTGDIILNLDYWDCECESNFIHPISQQMCDICGAIQEESPSSRENEVQLLLRR
jgi:hypothetical protein